MCDVTFRVASEADVGSILALDAGAKSDYLADYLPYYMDHTGDYSCIVAETAAHHIVGFVVMRTVDDSTTVVLKAARVAPEARGRGVYRALERHCVRLARGRGCSRKVISVDGTNPYFTSGRLLRTHRELCRKPYLLADVPASVTLPEPGGDGPSIYAVSDETLTAYLTDAHTRTYLFPDNVVNVDDFPYAARPSNVANLHGRNTAFYSNISTVDGQIKGVLSAGTSFMAGEHSYTIDIFGNDLQAIEFHVLDHLRRCRDLWKQITVDFCMCIQYTDDVRMTTEIKAILQRLKLQLDDELPNGGCTIVLEETFS